MSKKHFGAVAGMIRERYSFNTTGDTDAKAEVDELWGRRQELLVIAERMADLFEDDNPRFDCERFLVACGTHNSGVTIR